MLGKGAKQEAKPKVVLNPEEEKRRKAFLMSGVPDELRKQAVSDNDVVIVNDYPPFPTVSHVQQTGTDADHNRCLINIWNLPEVKLSLKPVTNYPDSSNLQIWKKDLIDKTNAACEYNKIKVTRHSLISMFRINEIVVKVA